MLLTASLGRGHRQVALAIEEALHALRPELRIRTTDHSEILEPALYRLAVGAYAFSLRHWQAGFDWFYAATARLAPGSSLHRRLHGLGQWRLLQLLRRLGPRAVVCTFPEQVGTLSELRRRALWRGPAVVVITDHTAHSQWLHPHVDAYCTPSAEVAAALVDQGCDPERVVVTGIPLRRAFGERYDPGPIRAELRLATDRPTVLVTAGPFGEIGPAVQAARAVCGLPFPARAVVVAGSPRGARRASRALGPQADVRVLGFVRNMARLFSVADLLVGKAGGVTTAEALCAGVPMILFRPAPGQERRNSHRLTAAGAAAVAPDAQQLRCELRRILTDPAELRRMRAAARRLAAPSAATMAAEAVLALLAQPAEQGVSPPPTARRPRSRVVARTSG